MRVSFVRTRGARDRIYATRDDGSEVSWSFPTYGEALPHDTVHLVVESILGLRQGFWGRVAAGCRAAGVPLLEDEQVDEVRRRLSELGERWRALGEKGAIELRWPIA